MRVTPQDLEALVQLFDQGDWDELHLQTGEIEVFLSKDPAARGPWKLADGPVAQMAAPAPAVPAPAALPASPPSAAAVPAGWSVVRAPSLGTFYRAPKPGAPPYVELGQAVEPDSEVCLIEVMKLFTGVKAGMAGTVREIYAKDGDLVEYDQPLFLVEPNG
jgi:acetyl-CoA carboxylase biotin carboxyl carrier protein